MWAAGIDIGSAFSKAVLGSDGRLFQHVQPSHGNFRAAAEAVYRSVLSQAGISADDVCFSVATGLGAPSVTFAGKQVPEISCHGRGAKYIFPNARTVIDIGDQACRVFKIDGDGRPVNFIVNEKCASGSGRFLQVMARVLQVDLSEIGPLSLKARNPVSFSTNCAVFAESEAISRIAEGAAKEDLLAGIHRALAAKLASMLERIGLEMDCVITGGGARDIGLVQSLQDEVEVAVLVAPEPHMTAALGAWVIAGEMCRQQQCREVHG